MISSSSGKTHFRIHSCVLNEATLITALNQVDGTKVIFEEDLKSCLWDFTMMKNSK